MDKVVISVRVLVLKRSLIFRSLSNRVIVTYSGEGVAGNPLYKNKGFPCEKPGGKKWCSDGNSAAVD